MTSDERSGAMLDRIARATRQAGLPDAAVTRIVDALRAAFLARSDITNPHDPAWLHPARNALILLEDLDVTDPTELCAAIHFDGTRAEHHDALAPDVATLLDAVPRESADDARLLEDLVVADAAARRIALVDRLDHARHLHLRPREEWASFHARTRAVWLPVAERTHATLARRLRWWTGMFERRWLGRARP